MQVPSQPMWIIHANPGAMVLFKTSLLAQKVRLIRSQANRAQCPLPVHHVGAAEPTSRMLASRLAISTAVAAASEPLFPTLPPARSSACNGFKVNV